MLLFKNKNTVVELEYIGDDWGGRRWVWDELKNNGSVEISRTFSFEMTELINPPDDDQDFDYFTYRFKFGKIENGYVVVSGSILGIENNLLISADLPLERAVFIAERSISIFSHISKLLETTNPIIIGGDRDDAIPVAVFNDLRKKFPNTYEINRYAASRIHTILSDYLHGMKDAHGNYENYLNKKMSIIEDKPLNLDGIKKLEIAKYVFIRDTIKDALEKKSNWSERQWQDLMKNSYY